MGDHYSDAAFAAKLKSLTLHQQAIEELTSWVLRSNAGKYVGPTWQKVALEEKNPAQLKILIYFYNDVVQKGKREDPSVPERLFDFLAPVFSHANNFNDADLNKALSRIVDIWRQRQVYDAAKLAILGNPKTLKRPASVIESSVEQPPKKHENVKKLSALEDPKLLRQNCEELIALLSRLEEPPSVNEQLRKAISALPPHIGNTDQLHFIRNAEQAKLVLAEVKRHDGFVKDYCKSLAQEVIDRRQMISLMEQLIEQLRATANRYVNHLQWLKKMRNSLIDDEKMLLTAYSSLPELPSADVLESNVALDDLFPN